MSCVLGCVVAMYAVMCAYVVMNVCVCECLHLCVSAFMCMCVFVRGHLSIYICVYECVFASVCLCGCRSECAYTVCVCLSACLSGRRE